MTENVELFNKERCASWLKEIGQSSTGTVEELRNKIRKYSLYPKLLDQLKAKTKRNCRFECSLNPLEIPKVAAKWSSDEISYPVVNEDIFYRNCSFKKEGKSGQQEKAFRMPQSRKIVSVKTLLDNEGVVYVQAMIKNRMEQKLDQQFYLLMDLIQRRDTAVVQLAQAVYAVISLLCYCF